MTGVEKPRILVVGINYAPEHAGIAPYTTGLCEQLVLNGHEVHVLAGLPSYPSWRVPAEYRRRRHTREVVNGVPVRRLWHYVPRKQSALHRGLYEASFGLHVSTARLPWKPDIVLAVVPSLLGGLAAARIARRHGAELAVLVQDLMGPAAAQSGIHGGARVASAVERLERRLLRSAHRVAVIHDKFGDYLRDEGVPADCITTVPNWSHVAAPTRDRAEVRQIMGWPESTVIALHTGNMGAKQALENVVEAARLADAQPEDIRFVLMGDGSQRQQLEQLGAGVHSLDITAPVGDDLYSDVLAAADVLLVNERATSVEMSLPSKLTSYSVSGRPIVAAVPPGGATAADVAHRTNGMLVDPETPWTLLAAVLEAARSASRESAKLERHHSVHAIVTWLAPELQTVISKISA